MIFTRTISILYDILFYQKANEITSKNYLEYIDIFKFVIIHYITENEKNYLDKFINKLIYSCYNFITNKGFIFSDKENLSFINSFFEKNTKELENFICFNFYIFLWFCIDVNKFLFKSTLGDEKNNQNTNEFYFEDDYNEKIYVFIMRVFSQNDKETFLAIIKKYNKTFQLAIKTTILENIKTFKEFLPYFYLNIDNFSYKFKILVKMMIIYILEFDQVFI